MKDKANHLNVEEMFLLITAIFSNWEEALRNMMRMIRSLETKLEIMDARILEQSDVIADLRSEIKVLTRLSKGDRLCSEGCFMKKKLIRTAPSQLEKTARTVRMNRPMRCATCGTTQEYQWIVKLCGKRGKRCSKCERMSLTNAKR